MTVTINTLGTNSRQLVIEGETSATNIINGVNTALTALGWTLYDTVTSGSRGCLTTKVYSAVNNDGGSPTTKYMIIRYDIPRQYWFVSCCESWNTSTNVATNESWYAGRQILLPLQYSNCILYVFATARYACFMGSVRGEYGPWQGVFEFERAAPEDTAAAGVPCFGWTSSLTIGECYGGPPNPGAISTTSSSWGQTAIGFAVPRTVNGRTGVNAANYFNIVTGIGEYPPSQRTTGLGYTSGGIVYSANTHNGMLGTFAENEPYVWDATKTVISNIKLGGWQTVYTVGKIYGLKVVSSLGAVMNTTTVPVDSNLFYSAGGTNTTHYILGIQGGYKDRLVTGTNKLTATISTTNTAIGSSNFAIVVAGRYVYLGGGIKYDLQTGTFTTIIASYVATSIVYDGENYIYFSNASTTISRVNITTDAVTTLVVGVNIYALAIDDTYLYCVNSGSPGTTTNVRIVTLSTFTETTNYNLTIGTINYATHVTTADYAGYLYVAGLYQSARSNCRIIRMLGSDGTNTSLTPTGTMSNTAANGQPLFFDGANLWFTAAANNGTVTTNILGHQVNLSSFTITSSYSASVAISGPILGGTGVNAYNAAFEPPCYGGFQLIGYNGSANMYRIPYTTPTENITTAFPIDYASGVFDSVNTGIGKGTGATDYCAYYAWTSTQLVRYTGAYTNYSFSGNQGANILMAQ